MEKPHWRVRSSSYIVDSPHLRLRQDEIELPNGSIIKDYYVRESAGYVMVFAMTPDKHVVLVDQYRYGNDTIALELPAGMLAPGEDALACAQRELAEETGYVAQRWEQIASLAAEPVRSNSVMRAFIAYDAQCVHEQKLDPTEHIDVTTVTLDAFIALLREGRLGSVACVAVGYTALDRLGAL